MDKGIYTALSGGLAKSREIELLANNLANANTPGFKRDTGTFNEYLTELRRNDTPDGVNREINALTTPDARPVGDKSFVEMDAVYTDFKQGTVQQTHRSLDVALEGKGFLEVLTPQGVRYTRAGNFSLSPTGQLVNVNGYPVLSKANRGTGGASMQVLGAPKVPGQPVPTRDPRPEARIIQLHGPGLEITAEGLIRQNGGEVAQLNIEELHQPQWLEKVGNSLFRNTDPANLKNEPVMTQVHQGFLENSNVNAVTEMTRLIEATRSYESHLQAIKTYQDIDARSVNDIAKER